MSHVHWSNSTETVPVEKGNAFLGECCHPAEKNCCFAGAWTCLSSNLIRYYRGTTNTQGHHGLVLLLFLHWKQCQRFEIGALSLHRADHQDEAFGGYGRLGVGREPSMGPDGSAFPEAMTCSSCQQGSAASLT